MASTAPESAASFRVRGAAVAEIPAMAALLGQTFQTGDAVGDFMFPEDAQRAVRQPRMFAAMIRHRYLPEGGADVAVAADGRIVPVILWSRSWGRPHPVRKLRESLALLAAMRGRVVAGLAVEAAVARGKPRDRHLYAMYLGVDPDWYGAGAAHALVAQLLHRADAEGVVVYGNCEKRLLPFYAEAIPDGRVTGSTTLGRGGPAFYFLHRAPQRPGTRPPG